ncbi:MAG: ABC transporter ATP-binding protein [Bacteroidales bacterium]|nr:ABC transporter ATP-binding protein [Bacteroidales bacterium]
MYTNNIVLRANNLSKTFATNDIKIKALNNITININKGEFIAIMGPSGCGKSTLLNILGLLDDLSSGEVYIMGKQCNLLNDKQKTLLRKSNIGFVFQNFNLIEELTVYENIELPLIYLKLPVQHRQIRVQNILEKLKIAHKQNQYPTQLSGGMQQKVAIGRAIVTNPKIILADEPTGNLDSESGNQVMRILSELNSTGTTVLIATHSLKDAEYSNRIINMLDGRITSQNYGKEYYKGYVGEKNSES